MQLWYAPTSPFARKVSIAVYELGLAERIALKQVDPWTDLDLRRLNPLAKVPTLVLDEGRILYESAVICDYFDNIASQPRIIPPDGDRRWDALLLQGLADGACTAAGRLFAEERRPADHRNTTMIVRFHEAIDGALDAMEGVALATRGWTVGEIGAATLLGYLRFRWPERDWRPDRPRLAAWEDTVAARPSLIHTAHHVPGAAA